MEWIRYYPLRAAALAVLLLAVGAGAYLTLSRPAVVDNNIAPPPAAATGADSTSSNQVASPTAAPGTQPTARVELPGNVTEFIERLNELNAFVSIGENREQAGLYYDELWQWGRNSGLEVYGLGGNRLTDRLTTAAGHEVLEIVSLEGNRFCIAEVSRFDRKAVTAPYLFQGLYNGSCADMLADPAIR